MSVHKQKRFNPKTGRTYEKYYVDVVVTMPNGTTTRVRKDSPVQTRRDAERFELELRRSILDGTYGKETRAEVPTLSAFKERFIEEYCEANKQCASRAS